MSSKEHPELVKKYLGSVVPVADNYFAALNRPAAFTASGVEFGSLKYLAACNHVPSEPSCLQCRLQRWLLLLHPEGHNLSYGDLNILPHQQQGLWLPCNLRAWRAFHAPQESGQFERTLLIADESSYVSYLEGCTARALHRSCGTCRRAASAGVTPQHALESRASG